MVEVLSPSTRRNHSVAKLAGYFSLHSVRHYLVIDPESPPVVLHSRQSDGTILTRIIPEGAIHFDLHDIEIAIADLFPAA